MGTIRNDQSSLVRSSVPRSAIFLPWLIAAAAVGVRLLPLLHVFSGGRVYLYDPDCYVRLRKILVYLQAFPATSVHDYFESFPRGTGIIAPPTMEYFVAALAYPFRAFAQLRPVIETAIAYVPVLVGAVTVIVLYRFMERSLGRTAAAVAAAVLALYPPFIDATVLGRFDNEMLEPLLLLATMRIYISTYEDQRNPRSWWSVGAMSVLFLSIWRGAIFPLSILGADLVARILSLRQDGREALSLGRMSALMYGTAAGLVAVICVTNLWETRSTFSFNIISWFHVALFGAAAAAMMILSAVISRRYVGPTVGVLAGYSALTVILLVLAGFLGQSLVQGMRVVGGGDVWIDSIAQYQRGMSAARAVIMYGGLSFAAPLAIFCFRDFIRERLAWHRLLLVWTLFIAVAVIARGRYAEHYGLNVAILSGIAFSVLPGRLARWRGVAGTFAPVIVALAMLLLQAPTVMYGTALYANGPSLSLKGDIEDTLLWMRDNTPSAGNPLLPWVRPDYGVLARWDYGGWIESVAERPTLTTNFGTEAYGMEDVAQFFLANSEEEMMEVLRRNEIRYMIIDKVIGDLPMYARIIGRENSFYSAQWDPRRKTTVQVPDRAAYSLISSRLFFADGSLREHGGIRFAPIEGVRLVYESATPAAVGGLPWEIRKLKVFERTDGAVLLVQGRPGRTVDFEQRIETNQGRIFTYRNEKIIAQDGTARFQVVYPARMSAHATGAVGPVILSGAGGRRMIAISDEDIRSRKIVRTGL